MAIVGFCADVHLGNPKRLGGPMVGGRNTRGRLVSNAYRAAVEAFSTYSNASCAGTSTTPQLYVCGDLFDDADPSAAVLYDGLEISSSQSVHVTIVAGNHDVNSGAQGDSALGVFNMLPETRAFFLPSVQLFHAETYGLVLMPYSLSEPMAAATRSALAASRKNYGARWPATMALAVHAGIIDGATPPYLRGAHDAIYYDELFDMMSEFDIDICFAGNWHNERSWETADAVKGKTRRIFQCGALAPTGFDNPGLDYGNIYTWNTTSGVVTSLRTPGPRFLSLTYAQLKRGELDTMLAGRVTEIRHLFLEVRAAPSEMDDARADAAAYQAKLGTVAGARAASEPLIGYTWDVVPDRAAVAQATHAAAQATARAGHDLRAALAAHAAETARTAGLDPDQLSRRVLDLYDAR